MAKYKITDLLGNELDLDGVLIECEDGTKIEVYPRKTDGYISISSGSGGTLVVYPRAANLAYVKEVR